MKANGVLKTKTNITGRDTSKESEYDVCDPKRRSQAKDRGRVGNDFGTLLSGDDPG